MTSPWLQTTDPEGTSPKAARTAFAERSGVKASSSTTGSPRACARGSTVCTHRRNGLEMINSGCIKSAIASGNKSATSWPFRSRPRSKSFARSRSFLPARACRSRTNRSAEGIVFSALPLLSRLTRPAAGDLALHRLSLLRRQLLPPCVCGQCQRNDAAKFHLESSISVSKNLGVLPGCPDSEAVNHRNQDFLLPLLFFLTLDSGRLR